MSDGPSVPELPLHAHRIGPAEDECRCEAVPQRVEPHADEPGGLRGLRDRPRRVPLREHARPVCAKDVREALGEDPTRDRTRLDRPDLRQRHQQIADPRRPHARWWPSQDLQQPNLAAKRGLVAGRSA
ncbi:MAG TPA: hypothetical protein VFV91_11630 [Gaiellaceae bacterium]|nr:hypothetical protein [Gaiellaceae bacterium]